MSSSNPNNVDWGKQRQNIAKLKQFVKRKIAENPIHSRYDEILEKEKARVANLKELAIKGNLEGLKHALSN